METYVSRFHETVAQFITTSPIMDLYLTAERRPGSRVAYRWWEQEGFDLEGIRTAAREAEQDEGEGGAYGLTASE